MPEAKKTSKQKEAQKGKPTSSRNPQRKVRRQRSQDRLVLKRARRLVRHNQLKELAAHIERHPLAAGAVRAMQSAHPATGKRARRQGMTPRAFRRRLKFGPARETA